MKLNKIGNSVTTLTLNDGVTVLFSYNTPVAFHRPGSGYWRTKQHYSKTTTKHINQWLTSQGCDERTIIGHCSQETLNKLVG